MTATVSDVARLEVLKNALEGIGDGMALTVMRTSRSTVVRQSMDFSTAVLSTRGELIGQGMCQPGHLGGMPPALQSCLKRYQGQVYPGDILINNDPYEGASHLPDIYLFKPVFVGDRPVAYVCAMSHHTDIGGRVAGGNACDSTEIYQEGLRIPPLKLYHRGEPDETLFRIIEKAVRVPEKVLGDLEGNVAGLLYGEREYLKLVRHHGVEELERYVEELTHYTEELTRRAIRALPDGSATFTDYIDDDGFDSGTIAIVATVTKEGDEIHIDFTGTSPQCKGAIQPVLASTKARVYAVVKSILGTDIPNTGGYFRPIRITAPEGCFVNPVPPAPVAARTLGSVRAAQAVFGAFAQIVPDRVFACAGGCEFGIAMAGYDKSRAPWKPWVQLEFYVDQAVGGYPTRDGADAQNAGIINLANLPVEILEAEQPLRVRQYALAADSEGAGKFRGGLGMTREYLYLMDDTTVQVRADRVKRQPYGLAGGQASAPTRIAITSAEGERVMPSKFLVTLNRGDSLRVTWPGGGGWGDPLERDPALVLEDALAEKVSVPRAREVYGVVVVRDGERMRLDLAATERLRWGRRHSRPDKNRPG